MKRKYQEWITRTHARAQNACQANSASVACWLNNPFRFGTYSQVPRWDRCIDAVSIERVSVIRRVQRSECGQIDASRGRACIKHSVDLIFSWRPILHKDGGDVEWDESHSEKAGKSGQQAKTIVHAILRAVPVVDVDRYVEEGGEGRGR